MKKMFKILLVCLLCISIPAGCSPKEKTEDTVVQVPQQTDQASTENSSEVSLETAESSSGAYVADKKTTQVNKDNLEANVPKSQEAPTYAVTTVKAKKSSSPQREKTITCTISIDCKSALGVKKVPNGGTILGSKKVSLNPGATVYDALKASGVSFSGKSYISAIGSIAEGDCGPKSGWMFSVNGKYSNVSCAKYTLSSGDNIKWRYTCNMGADIGAYRE